MGRSPTSGRGGGGGICGRSCEGCFAGCVLLIPRKFAEAL